MGCFRALFLKKKKRSDDNEYIQEYNQNRDVKLLLLGAGESGKSTILKQIKIIYDHDYTQEERKNFRSVVYSNTLQSMLTIINAMHHLGIPFENSNSEADINYLRNLRHRIDEVPMCPEIGSLLKRLWTDEGVQKCFRRSSEYNLNDSAPYYLVNINRIASSRYVPTQHDVLRTRAKTTGIVEVKIVTDDFNIRIIDVGGQRSERKKWISCFHDVTALIYCVALSEYDMFLEEDHEMNRLRESLKLFESICNNSMFTNVPIILFLNKEDIFREKLKKRPLSQYFPEYKGPNTFEDAAAFIKLEFEKVKRDPNKEIFMQFTTATDTERVNFVFECVKEIIISKNLSDILG